MVNRPGTTSLGCLVQLLILVSLVYCGMQVSEPYYRYYRYRDAITQQASFANLRNDDSLRKDILANADTIAMPQGAYYIHIARPEHAIHIWTSYSDAWTIWHYTRPVDFTIDVVKPL